MSEWNMVVGKREKLIEEARKILTSPNNAISEIRIAPETIEIFDGSGLVETALTGRVRIEVVVYEKNKEP